MKNSGSIKINSDLLEAVRQHKEKSKIPILAFIEMAIQEKLDKEKAKSNS